MVDRISKEQRSKNMAAVKCKNTKPEIIVRSHLHTEGFRFRLHDKSLPGKPDVILKKYETVIFVHGCFWHGHDCKKGGIPKTNPIFWEEKINKNVERDRQATKALKELGWNVLTVWECELQMKKREQTFFKLRRGIIRTKL